MQDISFTLNKLKHSTFRNSFTLKEKEKTYIANKGIIQIQEHAKSFIINRLAPKEILNDGRQTPYKGHPVFIAQHATATCCRQCLYKWHHISLNKQLDEKEIDYIIQVIMTWIKEQLKK